MKKVGYSVGLENLLARIMDFGRAYSSVETFRFNDWSELVHTKWALKSEHVGDVFSAFDVMGVYNREPIAGAIGEALGIVSRLTNATQYRSAAKYLLLLAIISRDGDIFLNALASSFDKVRFRDSLTDLINFKRKVLLTKFSQQSQREAAMGAVVVERQRTNKGGAARGGLRAIALGRPLTERTVQLGLAVPKDFSIIETPSEDYLEKVTITRRGWAESLGLFERGGLTQAGIEFLVRLGSMGFNSNGGFFFVWPTKFEIASAHFDIRAFRDLCPRSTIELHSAVCEGMSLPDNPGKQLGQAALADLLTAIYREYRSLAVGRSMIRNELPLAVVSATAHAISYATGSGIPALSVLFEELNLRNLGFTARTSQTIELAISARRRDNKFP